VDEIIPDQEMKPVTRHLLKAWHLQS